MGAQISNGETHLNTEEVLARILAYFEGHGLRAADVFALIDLDKSGFVSFDEFVQGVQLCIDGTHVAPSLTRENLWTVFCRFDEDHDGKLSVQDFISHLRPSACSSALSGFRNAHPAENLYHPSEHMHAGPQPLQPQPCEIGGTLFRRGDVVLRIARAVVRAGKTPMDLFDAVDANRDGQLSRAELERALRGFEPDLTAMDLACIFEAFDADHSGTVSAHEFCAAVDRLSPGAFVAVEKKVEHLGLKFRQQGFSFYDAFRVFDRDGDGSLTREEWQRAARHFAPELTQDGVEAIFRRFDADCDGFMSLGEFATFFESSVGGPPVARDPYSAARGGCTVECAVASAPPATRGEPGWRNCHVEAYGGELIPQTQELAGVPRAPAAAHALQEPMPERNAARHFSEHVGAGSPPWQLPAGYSVAPASHVQLEVLAGPAPTLLASRGALQEATSKKNRQVSAWERGVLETIRSCLSFSRSGFRLHEAFDRLDTSKSGYLDRYEFDRMATAYYPELKPHQLQLLFATVNASGSGRISFDEFSKHFA